MALQKTLTLKAKGQDVTINNAYIRVDKISGSKNHIQAEVSIISSHAQPEETTVEVRQCLFTPDLNGSNFIAQAYAHLKTLPDFSGSADV